MVYGRRDPGSPADVAAAGIEIVATYGEVEAEYASLRRSAALMDMPQRGVLRLTGTDRGDFLNRMLTNEIKAEAKTQAASGDRGKPLASSPSPHSDTGQVVDAFWLNRKGRIEADLTVVELGDELLLVVDATLAQRTADSFSGFLFSEDVAIENVSATHHCLSLHGPRAIEFLRSIVEGEQGAALGDLTPGHSRRCAAHGRPIIVYRSDLTGEVGLNLICRVEDALAVHEQLLEVGLGQGLRSIGWLAFNIARIEGGCAMHLIDFGLDSLPHETGILRRRVSFTKGCYLGQEVVARMESLGHPSKMLVGLKIEGEHMPVTGAQIFDPADQIAEVIGAVTSATPSPMLGRTIIAFGMVKYAMARAGVDVIVNAEGQRAKAVVHDLQFWPREK